MPVVFPALGTQDLTFGVACSPVSENSPSYIMKSKRRREWEKSGMKKSGERAQAPLRLDRWLGRGGARAMTHFRPSLSPSKLYLGMNDLMSGTRKRLRVPSWSLLCSSLCYMSFGSSRGVHSLCCNSPHFISLAVQRICPMLLLHNESPNTTIT